MRKLYNRITARLPVCLAVWLDHTIANRNWWNAKLAYLRVRIHHLKKAIKQGGK